MDNFITSTGCSGGNDLVSGLNVMMSDRNELSGGSELVRGGNE